MLNRLRGSACYLAGPMTDCDDLGTAWREAITPYLKSLGVVVLDPTNKPIDIGCENAASRADFGKLQANKDYAGMRNILKIIRRVDLRCIDLSSFIIVRLDGTPTVGTYEEISMGVSQCKPVLIWLDGDLNLDNVNPWLLAQVQLEHVFESAEDLLKYLSDIDIAPEHPEDRRWCLFYFEKLYREALHVENT